MALTPTEEALVRELIAQNAALLSLAGNEATISSKLGATKATLGDLASASLIEAADLLLVQQAGTDKSVTAETLLAPYFGDAGLAALTGLEPLADRLPYFDGPSGSSLAVLTAFARTLLDDGDAATALATLGLNAAGRALVTAAEVADMRDLLDLVPGVDVQAYDGDLAAIAALTTTTYGRSLLTLANAGSLFAVSGSAGSWKISFGGVFTVTVRDISPAANSSADFTYGAGHEYSSWARAWVEGDDNPGGTSSDRSVWISQTPSVTSARVRNDGDSVGTCWLFSFGV